MKTQDMLQVFQSSRLHQVHVESGLESPIPVRALSVPGERDQPGRAFPELRPPAGPSSDHQRSRVKQFFAFRAKIFSTSPGAMPEIVFNNRRG